MVAAVHSGPRFYLGVSPLRLQSSRCLKTHALGRYSETRDVAAGSAPSPAALSPPCVLTFCARSMSRFRHSATTRAGSVGAFGALVGLALASTADGTR